MKCARHPKVDTELTCTSCGIPICPDCAQPTPVGFKCPACAKSARTVRDLPPSLFARCVAATLATGVIGAMFTQFVPFFGAIILGYLVAHVAIVSSGRRLGPTVEAIAVASILIGLFAPLIPGALMAGVTNLVQSLDLDNPWMYIRAGIAIFVALGRLRYM